MNISKLMKSTVIATAKVEQGELFVDIKRGNLEFKGTGISTEFYEFENLLALDLSILNVFKKDILLKGIYCAVGIDVSKRSTGFSYIKYSEVARECSFGTYNLSVQIDNDGSVFYSDDYLAKVAFIEGVKVITQLITNNGRYLIDKVVTEDTVSSSKGAVNIETLRKLILLNYSLEECIDVGYIRTMEFNRVKVGSWKATLTRMAEGVGKYSDAKGKVVEAVNALDSDYLGTMRVNLPSKAAMDNNGYQDRLDATGLLLHGLAESFGKEFAAVSNYVKKSDRVDFKVVIEPSYSELMSNKLVNPKGLLATFVTRANNIETFIQQKFKQGLNEMVLDVSGSLGKFGVKYKVNELDFDNRFFIYIEKK